MKFIIIGCFIIISILCIYIFSIHRQLQKINNILCMRLSESTGQQISLDLIDRQLIKLAGNINRCLKAEEKLRLKVVKDEESFKDMITDISHDFRTPLTAIRAYLQLMEKEDLEPKQKQQLGIVLKHADYLGELIEHFFEYAYLVDTTPNVKLEPVNITNLLIEKVANAVALLENANIVPEIDENMCFVLCDEEMTNRIFENLLRNTVAHAKSYLKIYFTQESVNEQKYQVIHFENPIDVNDSIDTEKMFNRFYVSNQARKTTGLGLSIVKILTEQQGGMAKAYKNKDRLDIQIWLQSNIVEK